MKFLKKINKKYFLMLLPLFLGLFILLNTSITANQFPTANSLEELKKLMAESISRDKYVFTIIYNSEETPFYTEEGLDQLFDDASALAGPYYFHQQRQSEIRVGKAGSITTLLFKMNYATPLEQIIEIDEYVKKESDKILATTTNKAGVIKKINDLLKSSVTYSFETDNAFSAYGVVKEKSAYNSGYAFALERFFNYLGYESDIVKGLVNGKTNLWNMVKIDGNWYHVDIAENDRTSSDNYLLKSDTSMSSSRSWDYSKYNKASNDYDLSQIVIPTTPSNPTNPVVTDPSATATDWARAGVKQAIDSGLVPLSLQSRYQTNITREEFCELVVVLYEKIDKTKATYTTNPFTDTTNEAVLKANALGIVSGVGNNKFAPTSLITREQIAVMFNNTFKALKIYPFVPTDYLIFKDEAEISDWAKEAVQNLVKLEIMIGVGENRIAPQGNATIEQAILLANKMYIQNK